MHYHIIAPAENRYPRAPKAWFDRGAYKHRTQANRKKREWSGEREEGYGATVIACGNENCNPK